MGYAVAEAAARRGAKVVLVSGPVSLEVPAGVERVDVRTAKEMHRAVARESRKATVFIAAAAVSDYRAKEQSLTKIKKSAAELELKLERTPDILREVAQSRRNGQLIVGFAAETGDLLTNAREKLIAKEAVKVAPRILNSANHVFGRSLLRSMAWKGCCRKFSRSRATTRRPSSST